MKFDNILAEVNGFGGFQIRTMLLLVIARITLPFHFILNNFIAAIPGHHCNVTALEVSDAFSNLSLAQKIKIAIPVREDGEPNSCEMFPEAQYSFLFNSTNVSSSVTVPCQNGWVYDKTTFESTLATEWDLVCDNIRLNKAIVTIFFTGVMLGSAMFGYLSDRFGRKKTLLLSYIVAATFGFASAYTNNFATFSIMRFFTGCGLAGISIITVVLCIEWVDIKHRTLVSVILSLDWSLGMILLPIIAYFVNDWRNLIAATTSPLLMAIICLWWVPESARWLISNGKVKRAHYYLSRCAKVNHRDKFMSELNPEALSKVIIVEDENRKYSYVDLVKTPTLRRIALFTGIVWFGLACSYYGISLNIEGFGVNLHLTQFIYSAIEVPSKLLVFFTVNRVGRRFCQSGTLTMTGLCIFINMFIPKEKGLVRTALGALGKMFSEGAFTCVYLFTTELYPTVVRQNGLGYSSFMARIGVSVSPMILLLEEFWVHLPSTVFCVLAFAAGLVAVLLPETRNVRLPETIEDVEQTRKRSICTLDGNFSSVLIIIISFIGRFTMPCHFMLNNFIGAVPAHHCDYSYLDQNERFRNLTPVQKLAWDLVCDKKGKNKATATIFFIGVMFGAMTFGLLSDRLGRRIPLLLSYVSGMLFAVATAFSTTYVMFAVLRFFTGFCITGIVIVSAVLSVEWVDIEHRKLVGVIDSLSWTFGNTVFPLIAYFVTDWRWLMISVTSPVLLAILTWRWMPESARWLIANGKLTSAQKYLKQCAKMNNRNESIHMVKPEALRCIVVTERRDRTYSYLDLIRIPKLRNLACRTGLLWFCVAIAFYGISFNITGFGLNMYLTQFTYALIELPAKLSAYFLWDRIGRRPVQVGAQFLAALCLAVNIFIPRDMAVIRTVVAVIGKGFSSAAFGTLVLYSSELYPTVLRQNGMGYNSFMARLGVALAPLVLLLEDVWKELPQVILCCAALLGGLVARSLSETRNRCLPETIEDIEKYW
ncbi:solute carrier family 22 member 7-like [Periophthalmus magnuspinnatus]|uniref:solute carrier family 22 member 7-like n=1 Tax=Periophthalmus magnuspinnatus TaxID=409849 RepID=UPI0024372EC0|nr:solute carrier family 22 member 7-like [Periophthalmus magnuspinnatus]